MKTRFFKNKEAQKEIKNNFFNEEANVQAAEKNHDVNEYKEFYLGATRWDNL